MGAYSYQALDAKGKTVKGVLEGDSERQVRTLLRQKQLRPLEVKSSVKKVSSRKGKAQKSAGPLGFSFGGSNRGPKLKHKDLCLVTRQLASLVQSGLPLDEVLAACANQSRNPTIKSLILQVRSRVLEGLSLTQAMAESPRAFDNLYRAMVKAGESSGYLGPVLEQLAEYAEMSQETRQKIKAAMIYPIVLLLVSFSVVAGLMAFVVPKLVGIFESQQQQLPKITEILIAVSDYTVNYGIYTLIGIVLLILGFSAMLKEPKRQKKWHAFILKWPLVGELTRTAEASRYSSTLGLLTKSGVPLLDGLRIASQVVSNRHIQAAASEVAVSVKEGMSLHKALDQSREFPPLLVQMAASGEQNGELAEQLVHAARNQNRELQFTLSTLMSLLEPATILFMGVTVGGIVMAIMLPIFQMNSMV